MEKAKDILLHNDNDLEVVNGDFFIGESEMQEVGIILQMNQGELKSDALIGANLVTMIRSGFNKEKIERHIATQMELDSKNFDDIKQKISYGRVV
ncbi:MAG: hypothetical protein ABI549_13410 [Flavobacterium sp.]|uniref:hypothetical protein n=1 Tax=Flavobacterium sp. TaxID=239 RepID=UPI0032660A86